MKQLKITPDQVESWISRNFQYKKKSGGRQIIINNPFNGDTGYHFWISLEDRKNKHGKVGYWVHDFRTNQYDGSFVSFVKKYRNISYFAALSEVCGKSNLKDVLRSIKSEPEPEPEIEEYISLPSLSNLFTVESKAGDLALKYLESRGVSKERVLELGLYYTPVSIVFPYIEYGSLVYWQERYVIEKRFVFPDESKTGLSKTDFLYNFDYAEQPHGNIVIVESIFNCISIGDDCVATGGATISSDGKQVAKLEALLPKLVVLAPDNDPAGINSLLDNLLVLKKRLDCSFAYCIPPKGIKDWNDLDQRDGSGSSRNYIKDNSCMLDIKTAMRLRQMVLG